jgi:hypothetical protein
MWNCNGSASPACPARRVLPIVTHWVATDEMGTPFSGLEPGGCTRPAARPTPSSRTCCSARIEIQIRIAEQSECLQ